MEKSTKCGIYNISGDFEQKNITTVKQIIKNYYNKSNIDIDKYVDFSVVRPGQDIRYSIDDSKIRDMGWKPKIRFGKELPNIVEHYKDNFIW